MTGCNDEEISRLKNDLEQQEKRATAFQDDAKKARATVDAAQQEAQKAVAESEELKKQVQQLKDQIEEIHGIKQLQELGAVIQRNANGSVVSFDMRNVQSFTNEQLEPLVNFKSLEEVYLSGPSINVGTFEILAQLPKLRILEASISGTNTECLEKLSPLKELTYLQLKRTSVTDDSMAVLAEFPKIATNPDWTNKVGDEGLKHLQN